MIILYPIVASMTVVVAQYAYTRGKIAELHQESEVAKLWKSFRNFCYLWAVMLMVAAFLGHFWYDLGVGF